MLPEMEEPVRSEDEKYELLPELTHDFGCGLMHVPNEYSDRSGSFFRILYRFLVWGTRNNNR